MEFEDHEEQEDDMEIPVSPPGYDSLGNNSGTRSKMGVSVVGGDGGASTLTAGRKVEPAVTARYRECQKNHAVSLGAHAVDGCGEFIAAGAEGTLDALKCAACNCHRNFHRKETDGGEMTPYQPPPPHHLYHQQFPPYYCTPPPPAGYLHHHLAAQPMAQQRPLALPAAALSRDEEDMSNPSSSGGGGSGGGGGGKKRYRTKFTQEQKEKMLAFAERVGWRIQKHDEAALEQFCEETCVKRHVLKVWMHNNKHTLERK